MVFSVEDIRRRIAPVARKYGLREVYLFGSYARNEATEDSDVDLLIDRTGSTVRGMFDMGGLYNDLADCLGKPIDLVTTQTLEQASTRTRTPQFVENLCRERLIIYH